MIELRWLEKPKEQPIYDAGENVRVLQYRIYLAYTGLGTCWSDWQDVPTVSGEDARSQ